MSAITGEMVIAAVHHHLDGRGVASIKDRGMWIRHSFEVRLNTGEVVYLKADRAFPASEKEAYICELLRSKGLPAPEVLAVDTTCRLLPTPYVIQAHVGGESLATLMDRVGSADRLSIYGALGRFYRRLHDIHHDHSGWIQGSGQVLPLSPGEYQYQKVILEIGSVAVDRGLLSADVHRRLREVWAQNTDWLALHVPSLVAGALPWTIYLAQEGDWHVSKVMDLHDFLYWDPAWDLAGVKYPVFREPLDDQLWRAFTSEYGRTPDEKRLNLYRLMQHLDAAMGNYLEPAAPHNGRWKQGVWSMFGRLIDDVQQL